MRNTGCIPLIWLDGQRSPGMEIDEISLGDIEGIELYTGTSTTPPQFWVGTSNHCGTIVIWTRVREHPERPRLARFALGVPLFVGLITVVVFLPTLANGFVNWDDEKNFLPNPHYRGLGLEQLGWMWSTFHLGHYVPLSWMTLGFDYTLWGMNPKGYHLTNVLLHAACAVALYFVARRILRLTGEPQRERGQLEIPAAFAALLFAVHPLRVELVAWVTERRECCRCSSRC